MQIGVGSIFGNGDDTGDVISADVENLIGSAFLDLLIGSAGANTLAGGGGNDRLEGNGGADHLIGGDGIDTVSYFNSQGSVTVNLATQTASGGDAQGDVLDSFERATGGAGSDTLIGGTAEDKLNGGIGADRFAFITLGDSVVGAKADRINDFSRAQGDKIDLSGIDASTALAGNQAFSFIGSALYHHVAGELRFAVAGGTTTIAGDVNGDGTSDFHIVLTGAIALTAADFVL